MFNSSVKILLLVLVLSALVGSPLMVVADEVTGQLETGSGKGDRVIFYSEKTSTSSSTSSGSTSGTNEQDDSSNGGGGGGGGSVAMTSDETESRSSGDINDDNSVDKYDFSLMMSAWETADSDADLNDDNTVDKYDFALLMSNWSGS